MNRDTPMLPFELPRLTRGYAELTPDAAAAGLAAAAAAAAEIGQRLGMAASVAGRALPGPDRGPAGARLAIDLPTLPGVAMLEVEAGLVARVVDRLAGGTGEVPGAVELTPLETSVLEMLALLALEGAAREEVVERALSPRLARSREEPSGPMAVTLDLELDGLRGRGRLLVPATAVRALRGPPAVARALAGLELPASLRSGQTALSPGELSALSVGDVVLLDCGPGERAALVLPGGYRIAGRLEQDAFQVEEMAMTEHAAAVPVMLQVELARITVTLAELARLEPGAALPLHLDRQGLVTLRVGERAVARGELVEIDGAVGVRVTAAGEGP